jgi:transposase InsO family protein
MSTEEKVRRVKGARERFGLAAALEVLELSRSTWYYHNRRHPSYEEKYEHLRKPLEAIARAHSEYGYRRTTVELREVHGWPVNRKVVQRLHRLWDLPLLRGTRRPKPSGVRRAIQAAGPRVNKRAKQAELGPFEMLYTDFTELVYAGGRKKAQLIPILDHVSKMALGWAVGERAVTELALEAWEGAKETLSGLGASWVNVIVHHDQDPVFTSYAWTSRLLLDDGVQLSYALNGARDNPEMESFNSRFKCENRSLISEAQSFEELVVLLTDRFEYYNRQRRHSSIGYLAPLSYVMSLKNGKKTKQAVETSQI